MTDTAASASSPAFATSWRSAVHGPARLTDRLRVFARRNALSLAAALDRRLAARFVRCLYCHYVFDDQAADFENLITRLKSLGTFVTTDDLLDMLTGRRPVDGRYFHLSFDDGFRNNFTNAVPILRRHAVPAIFFVPSGLIGADWERTRSYCLNVTHYRTVIETLRWDDLKAMLDAGFEIGSHTRTHARFSAMSAEHDRLQDEILGSKEDLEQGLGYRCRYISWPYGKTTDADASSVGFTKTAGYDACFGAFRGTVVPGATDRYRIPRHHFEPQWLPAHVEYFARGNMEQAG